MYTHICAQQHDIYKTVSLTPQMSNDDEKEERWEIAAEVLKVHEELKIQFAKS